MAKASKVIPVMLMGKLISGKKYEYYEYVTAVMISAGLSMFLMTSGDTSKHTDTATTTSGIIMLIGYMMFDSFTSNWQVCHIRNFHHIHFLTFQLAVVSDMIILLN